MALLLAACDDDTPAGPTLLMPTMGSATGSVWSARALMPEFKWAPVSSASSYQIQIDDSCTSPAACEFPSPEIDTRVSPPAYVPSTPLPVSMAPPVGRRYFWRVRACPSDSCGPWSPTRYVDVGRQRQDWNGDGYADLVVSALGQTSDTPAAFVYLGNPDLSLVPYMTIVGSDPTQEANGSAVSWIGDMDGDGFSELAVSSSRAPTAGLVDYPTVRVYRGGVTPAQAPAVVIDDMTPEDLFNLHAADDFNGDGFLDLYFAAGVDVPAHRLLLGSASLATDMSHQLSLGSAGSTRVVGACDMNADGFSDLVAWRLDDDDAQYFVGPAGASSSPTRMGGPGGAASALGACAANPFGTGAPALAVWSALNSDPDPPGVLAFASNPLGVPADGGNACASDLPAPAGHVPSQLAFAPTATDVDGDGYDDLLVGEPVGFNRAVLYFGGCPAQRLIELPGSTEIQTGGSFGGEAHPDAGYAVAIAGDLDGDGYAELVVGNPYATPDSFGVGEVYVYKGGATIDTTPTVVLRRPNSSSQAADGFGAALD